MIGKARTAFILGILLLCCGTGRAGDAETIQVSQTWNKSPFAYKLEVKEARPSLILYKLTYPSSVPTKDVNNNTVHGEVYLPRNVPATKSHPGVLVLHTLDNRFDLERLICTTLANNGIPALFILMPYYGERGGSKGRLGMLSSPDMFTSTLRQGILDARRAVDIIASRPEVDSTKIGVTGCSLGAITSATLCGYEPRISRAMFILGGGNLEAIFNNPCGETRPFKKFLDGLTPEERKASLAKIRRFDPLTHAAALRKLNDAGRLRMVNAADDQIIPPACTRELASAIGCDVEWLPGVNHYTIAKESATVFRELAQFFAQDVPAGWRKSSDSSRGVLLALSFLRGMSQFACGMPVEGKAHRLTATVTIKVGPDGSKLKGDIALVRGWDGKYVLNADVPGMSKATLAHGSAPWMSGKAGVTFRGALAPLPGKRAVAFITPSKLLKYQIGVGALLSASATPDVITQMCDFKLSEKEQKTTLTLTSKSQSMKNGRIEIVFDKNEKPLHADIDAAGIKATIDIREWSIDAATPASAFEPPAGTKCQDVRAEDVLRMSAAVYERILEEME